MFAEKKEEYQKEEYQNRSMHYLFKACRITGGNLLFPDRLEIDDTRVIFYKGHIIGHDEIVIQRGNIGCINVNIGLFFGDITIETNGGQRILANGFTRKNAKQIRELLA